MALFLGRVKATDGHILPKGPSPSSQEHQDGQRCLAAVQNGSASTVVPACPRCRTDARVYGGALPTAPEHLLEAPTWLARQVGACYFEGNHLSVKDTLISLIAGGNTVFNGGEFTEHLWAASQSWVLGAEMAWVLPESTGCRGWQARGRPGNCRQEGPGKAWPELAGASGDAENVCVLECVRVCSCEKSPAISVTLTQY